MILSSIFASEVSPTSDTGWSGGAPVGQQSASGMKVTTETAMRTSAVFACVRLISETVGSLPVMVYQRKSNGSKTPVATHPLFNTLHDTPNAWQTPMEFREMSVAALMLRGNSYAFKNIGARGQIEELIPLHPDRVKPMWKDDAILYEVQQGNEGSRKTETYTSEYIHHVRGLSLDGLTGISPIDYQKESIGTALAAQDYGSRFFANDATPRGVLQHPTNFKDKESLLRFKMGWREAQTGPNRHSTAVLEDGVIYKEIGMTNEAAQFLETRKFTVTDIARIFRVPPHMIADLERATFSNISDQSIEFVVYCIRPWVVRLEQAIKRDLIVEPDIFVKFNVDGLLRGDMTARYTAHATSITNGWMTRNEVRELEDMNPLDGLDEPLSQLNMQGQRAPEATPKENMPKEKEPMPKDKNQARIDSLELAGCERIARREAKAGNSSSEFVASVLGIDKDLAINIADAVMELNGLDEDEFIKARADKIMRMLKCTTT